MIPRRTKARLNKSVWIVAHSTQGGVNISESSDGSLGVIGGKYVHSGSPDVKHWYKLEGSDGSDFIDTTCNLCLMRRIIPHMVLI